MNDRKWASLTMPRSDALGGGRDLNPGPPYLPIGLPLCACVPANRAHRLASTLALGIFDGPSPVAPSGMDGRALIPRAPSPRTGHRIRSLAMQRPKPIGIDLPTDLSEALERTVRRHTCQRRLKVQGFIDGKKGASVSASRDHFSECSPGEGGSIVHMRMRTRTPSGVTGAYMIDVTVAEPPLPVLPPETYPR